LFNINRRTSRQYASTFTRRRVVCAACYDVLAFSLPLSSLKRGYSGQVEEKSEIDATGGRA
jgi:hypothetical protein